MQSLAPRHSTVPRRARTACPRCGLLFELSRMRMHLREQHQLDSARVETEFLSARRGALRGGRGHRR
jgi:hypothetical protein